MRISIGIAAGVNPGALDRTRTAVERTAPGADITVLGGSGAAAFNQLVAASAGAAVLLESGALPAPGWLDALIEALGADPRNGLAGPTTNRCWNEQGAGIRPVGDGEYEIACAAAEALRRYGRAVRTLAPLYSLADFCYAVTRAACEAVGPADEAYGAGPCWEMDYNIRAARAGFRGVWVCAAYVHRLPVSPARQREEAAMFERNKRLYQSKFCARQLTGSPTPFRSHCRGDECPNFAPPALIRLSATAPLAMPPGAIEHTESPPSAPLVTCIMPTCNRRQFIPGAVERFLSQDYACRELLVVDDGEDAIADLLPADERIRYLRLPRRLTVGAKRNVACQSARGELIAHWDDDDWYAGDRLSRQVRALHDSGADVCGTSWLYYYDPAALAAYEYGYAQPAHAWLAGNTLLYRKEFWRRHPFAEVQVGEDTRFVAAAAPGKVHDLRFPALCVGWIHAGNVSAKRVGGSYWSPQPLRRVLDLCGDRLPEMQPMVSCIMPTANRPRFVELAVENFEAQDYPDRELIIVDDGNTPAVCCSSPRVRYLHVRGPLTIGAKRNLACREAAGQVIAHWDDDDWYAPSRLAAQAAPIASGAADLTGLDNRFVLDLASGAAWTVTPALHKRMFVGDVHGGTLAYRKSILGPGVEYPPVNLAEDAVLLQCALKAQHRLSRVANDGLFVYTRHGQNAWRFESGRFLDPSGWSRTALPPGFTPELLARYCAAARTGRG